jgi:hypothetical protein
VGSTAGFDGRKVAPGDDAHDDASGLPEYWTLADDIYVFNGGFCVIRRLMRSIRRFAERHRNFSSRSKCSAAGEDFSTRATQVHFNSSTLSESSGDCAEQEISRNWLAKPWRAIASRRAHWRRQHEIKKAAAALTKLDDGTLRGIGVLHRSLIEQVVRYCRDC